MRKKTRQLPLSDKWLSQNENLRKQFPHIYSLLAGSDDFEELRIKARDDGTILGILKGYDSDGSPVVCFGSGYDFIGVLMSLDASVQGDNWKPDKPWKPPQSKEKS